MEAGGFKIHPFRRKTLQVHTLRRPGMTALIWSGAVPALGCVNDRASKCAYPDAIANHNVSLADGRAVVWTATPGDSALHLFAVEP